LPIILSHNSLSFCFGFSLQAPSLRLPKVEAVLVGQPTQTATFDQAAKMATDGVSPLPQTGYKVPLLYGTVLETLERAQQRVWGGEG
jgi:CO/xanthine dehydrogenase FAD-binding subunit